MNTDESSEAHNLGQPSFSKITYKESLVRQLNKVLKERGLVSKPNFSEILHPPTVHLLLVDKQNGLVARVGLVKRQVLEETAFNLELVASMAAVGAPVLPPITTEILVINDQGVAHTVTLWPLADNRLVTPGEMAETLRGIHDTPLLPGMPDGMHTRFGRLKQWSAQLPSLPDPPPQNIVQECQTLVGRALDELQLQLVDAPRRPLHGDAHPLNTVILKGKPLACDLDEICAGPIEIDLSMAFIQAERYPGADPLVGEKLAAAYGRPYNANLLRSIIHARCVSRALSLIRFWEEPGAKDDFYQRLDAIENGGRFRKLYGGESLSMFAGSAD